MSTLWTPGGERPIRRDAPPGSGGTGEGGGGGSRADSDEDREPTEAEVRAQMAALQEQLANTPAELVIANHAFGLFELAALHLSLQPPQLEQARMAIDALAGIVDALGTRLGETEDQLTEGLSQLRMAYVQIHAAAQAGGAPPDGGPAGAPDEVPEEVPDGESDPSEGA